MNGNISEQATYVEFILAPDDFFGFLILVKNSYYLIMAGQTKRVFL